jgi:hypothetical protein
VFEQQLIQDALDVDKVFSFTLRRVFIFFVILFNEGIKVFHQKHFNVGNVLWRLVGNFIVNVNYILIVFGVVQFLEEHLNMFLVQPGISDFRGVVVRPVNQVMNLDLLVNVLKHLVRDVLVLLGLELVDALFEM